MRNELRRTRGQGDRETGGNTRSITLAGLLFLSIVMAVAGCSKAKQQPPRVVAQQQRPGVRHARQAPAGNVPRRHHPR